MGSLVPATLASLATTTMSEVFLQGAKLSLTVVSPSSSFWRIETELCARSEVGGEEDLELR